MTLTEWISELRTAGVTRVELDLAPTCLPQPQLHSSFPADQAPRPPQGDANAQAESPIVHSEPADDADPGQQARDLELMHSE